MSTVPTAVFLRAGIELSLSETPRVRGDFGFIAGLSWQK